jgi:competence protein ComEA
VRLWRSEAAGLSLVAAAVFAVALASAARPDAPADVRAHRVDLNLSSRDELALLPGVGPATAERIVAGRPWASLDALRPVLGDRLVDRIAPHVTLDPRAAPARPGGAPAPVGADPAPQGRGGG